MSSGSKYCEEELSRTNGIKCEILEVGQDGKWDANLFGSVRKALADKITSEQRAE